MGPLDTKLLIADAFVELCDEMPLKKVSISDIVERTGKNRKTFYYHFVDKEALIIWRFRYDLGLALQRKFPESILVYEEPSKDSVTQFPFYITQKSGVRSLDHSKFFDVFASVLEKRRTFYTQALLETGPHALRNYLYDLYLPALQQRHRYHSRESLSARREYRVLERVLYVRIPVLLHPQVRSTGREAPHQQRWTLREPHS